MGAILPPLPMRLLLALSLVVAACTGRVPCGSSTPCPPGPAEPAPPTSTPSAEPSSEPSAEPVDWTGSYLYEESLPDGERTLVWGYALDLAPVDDDDGELSQPADYLGTLEIDGYQTMARYVVVGQETADGLRVVVEAFGPDHAGAFPDAGATLFTLRMDEVMMPDGVSDPLLMTVWATLQPNVVNEWDDPSEGMAAFEAQG